MRFFLTTLLSTLFVTLSAQAQTYYYERIAMVENGQKSSASGDGHFITFTRDGRCYDSTIKGYNENYGIRRFSYQRDGITCYEGQSYWGSAKYLFNDDKSRLNIRLSSGKTLVYARKTAPVGVTESNRKPHPSPSYTGTVPVTSSTTPSYNNNNSTSSNSSSSSNQSRYGYYTCPSCYGSGRCPICKGKHITNNSYTGGSHICYSCNNRGDCSACGGTGKKYGVIR